MNQLPCPGCQQVYPVPPNLPPTTPFTCQRCGFASTLGGLLQAAQQAVQQASLAQQGDLSAPALPGHGHEAPERPLAQMPQVKPSGLPAGGLDLADEATTPVNIPPPSPQAATPQSGGMAVIQPNRSKTDQYGNPIPDIDVVCPKCNGQSKVPPDTDMDFAFRCQNCGHSDRLGNVLLNLDADKSAGAKAKPSTSANFYDDIPEELKQPTAAELIQKQAGKRDPRLPAIGAVLGIMLLIGIPLFSGGDGEIDPRLARQGIKPESNMGMKVGIFAGVCCLLVGGVWFLLRPEEEVEEDEAEEVEEES